jgi:hypothetical protein
MSCCGKKFLITEDERRHILSLYGLLKEEEGEAQPQSQTTTSALKFDKSVNFAPGYYRLKGPVTTKAGVTYNWDVNQTLNSDLEKIKEFLKKNPSGYIVEVNLYSGESKIPNNDNEQGGTKVEENYLNKARLNSLKSYLNPIFESWKTEGITKTDFKINEYMSGGTTNWKGTPFCPANTTDERLCTTKYNSLVRAGDKTALDYKAKYDKEQYFRVIIEVKKVESPQTSPTTGTTGSTTTTTGSTQITEDCATGLRIKVEVEKHNCNNAEFFLFLNDTLLYNVDGGYTANGNNANTFIYADSGKKIKAKRLNPGYGKIGTTKYGRGGDLGGERYDEFIVTAEQSKQIIKQSNDGKINVWYICTLSTGCHLDTPTVRIYKDDLPIYEGQPLSDSALLITLDACGNKVSDVEDTSAREPDVSSMRETLQNDRMSMVIDDESDVPDVQDTKQQQLRASNTLNTMLEYIDKLFTHPTISDIYFDRTSTKPKTFQKTQSWKNATYYINYNLPENKELFDWFRTKLEDQSFLLYKDEITRLIKENKYEMKDDQFVDKTIRNDKLFGDVRQNLENFYNSFNRQFYFDDSGNVYLKGDDESYPLDYVTMLSKVSNPYPIYGQKQIKKIS